MPADTARRKKKKSKAGTRTRQSDLPVHSSLNHCVILSHKHPQNLLHLLSPTKPWICWERKNAWNLSGLLQYLFWQPKLIVHFLSAFWQCSVMTRTAIPFLFSLAGLPGVGLMGSGVGGVRSSPGAWQGCRLWWERKRLFSLPGVAETHGGHFRTLIRTKASQSWLNQMW